MKEEDIGTAFVLSLLLVGAGLIFTGAWAYSSLAVASMVLGVMLMGLGLLIAIINS